MSAPSRFSRSRLDQYPSPLNVQASNSRSSYPTFLSLQDSLLLQLKWGFRGLYDAFRWNIVISMVASDAEIRANMYKSLLLNSLSLASIYTFDLLLLPLVQDQETWLHRNVGLFYQLLWLLPVVGVSFYLNVGSAWDCDQSTWCNIIAKRTYTLQHGAQTAAQAGTYTGMVTAIATSAYRVVMVFTSIAVSFALQNIPYVGFSGGFVFMCWVDAYYCFEFVWIARGMSLSRRIRHLEERWAYYLAFGLPSTAICTWGTGLANAAIFALIFPAYIILAMYARPVPVDPYSPLPPDQQQDGIQHPSPFVPIRLPIFSLVMWLNDLTVKVLSVGGSVPPKKRTGREMTESMEEGSSVDRVPLRPIRDRVKIGRKVD